ncbi:MAG TPA: insulinase family protein [Candidatus Onthovicinus excrementipullorum]|nr:insulinase family protein [Candidatus Onthovicinus excrementipullorum]
MERIEFANGFRVMLERVEGARSATMGVWIGSGSRYECPENAGISHFIEHMLFKGTPRRSAWDIAEQMDSIGGALNAYTAKEYTCVYARALNSNVPAALDIICDMIANPRFDAQDLETEKGVILEEIGMYEDSPEDLCVDMMYSSVWRTSRLGANILGTRETVGGMTPEQIRSYKEKMYVPERMVAAIAGSFDRDEVLMCLEKYFGGLANTASPIMTEPADYHRGNVLLTKDFEQTQIALGFPGISATDERRFAMQVLNTILGSASSSRLYQRIREELGLVYSIDFFSASHLDSGLSGVLMALAPQSEERALYETICILDGIKRNVSEKEITRAKEQYAASLIMGMENTPARAAHMGRSELIYGRVPTEDELIERIRNVSAEQVMELARELLRFDQMSIAAVGKVKEADFYSTVVDKASNVVY